MKKNIITFLPWLLLILILFYCAFYPVKGLIGPVNLPEDDGFLSNEKVQWWYWTGHLKTEEGREFGFETVFFAFNSFIIMRDQLTQFAITDVKNQSFHFKEYLHFGLPEKIKNGFNMKAGPNNNVTASGGNGKDTIHGVVDGYTLDLQIIATKEPVLHYSGGPHPFRYGGYTYYYSREHMQAEGTITVEGKTHKVTGTVWFDRQYGDLYQSIMKGWQWFAIELEDNRQIMLYDFLGKANQNERFGSITNAKGKTQVLGPHDFQVKALGKWKSPHTGCTYPMGWNVTIGEENFTVTPKVVDQELRASHGIWIGPEYWEGTNYVKGKTNGNAYVELNGFCRGVEGSIDIFDGIEEQEK